MPKKRVRPEPPCRCGARRIRTIEEKPFRLFWVTFRQHATVQRCLACKRIRHKEVVV